MKPGVGIPVGKIALNNVEGELEHSKDLARLKSHHRDGKLPGPPLTSFLVMFCFLGNSSHS